MDEINIWNTEATYWNSLIEKEQIGSRKFTNQAILDVLATQSFSSILDVGCGEGWLVRSIGKKGVEAVGIDGSAKLIELAKSKSEHDFYVFSYAEIASDSFRHHKRYDVIVFNFSLFAEDLLPLFNALKALLTTNGLVIIQTLHPYFLAKGGAYKSRWFDNVFKGLPASDHKVGHAWYGRTMGDWQDVFKRTGFRVEEIKEPIGADSSPASVIFTIKMAI